MFNRKMYTHVRGKKKKVKRVDRSFRECRGLMAKHSDILIILLYFWQYFEYDLYAGSEPGTFPTLT